MPHYPGMLFVAVVVLGASLVCARAETDEKGFVRITPEKVEWKTLFGAGSTPLALLDGDPSVAMALQRSCRSRATGGLC